MPIRGELIKSISSDLECKGESQIYFDEDLRFITVSGVISWKAADVFFNTLTAFEVKDLAKPITVFINSDGGDIYAAWKVYDHMRYISCPIITVAAGLAFSGGLIIFMAGDKRLMHTHAILRFHEPWRQTENPEFPRDSAEANKHHQYLYRNLCAMFLERGVRISKKQLVNYLLISKRVDAKTAVKLGLAHKIITPRQKVPLELNDHQKNLLDLNETH